MTKTTIFARARAYNADYLTEETRQLIAEGEPVLVATLVRSPWASRPHRLVVQRGLLTDEDYIIGAEDPVVTHLYGRSGDIEADLSSRAEDEGLTLRFRSVSR